MDNLTEIPFYRVLCDCGSPLQATAAQAGEILSCSACGKSVQIPSYTALQKKRPDGHIPTGKRRPYQFDLAELLALVTVFALILSFCKSIDTFLGEHFFYFFGPLLAIFGWIVVLMLPVFGVSVIRRGILWVGEFIDKINARRNQ
jgi:hypothetical protein